MSIKKTAAKYAAKALSVVTEHSPEILVGVGVIGVVATAVLAVKATPKALSDIDEARREKKNSLPEEATAEECALTTTEIVKASWKNYVPAAISAGASIASIIGARNIQVRKLSALGAAYQATVLALDDKSKYVEKLETALGKKKTEDVRAEHAQTRVEERKPAFDPRLANGLMSEEQIFLDDNTGQFFKSTRAKVERVMNEMNQKLRGEMYIQENELITSLGERPIGGGDLKGWNINDSGIEWDIRSTFLDEDKALTCALLIYDPAIEVI